VDAPPFAIVEMPEFAGGGFEIEVFPVGGSVWELGGLETDVFPAGGVVGCVGAGDVGWVGGVVAGGGDVLVFPVEASFLVPVWFCTTLIPVPLQACRH